MKAYSAPIVAVRVFRRILPAIVQPQPRRGAFFLFGLVGPHDLSGIDDARIAPTLKRIRETCLKEERMNPVVPLSRPACNVSAELI